MLTWVCRVASALLASFLVVMLGTAAVAATPAPVPSTSPGSTVVVTGWTCEGSTASPDPSGSATYSEACSATSYAVTPGEVAPSPVLPPAVQDVRVVAPTPLPVTGSGTETSTACGSPDAVCEVSLTPRQFSTLELAAGLLVMLAALGAVMAWRRDRA